MSPRAAWRLESLGFDDVSDYVAGKDDWLGMGLPTEGRPQVRLKDLVRRDIVTCALAERTGDVAERVRTSGWDVAVVLNEDGVVLGLLGRHGLHEKPDARAEEVMTDGPSTYRPSVGAHEMRHHLEGSQLTTILVTRSDGTFMGAVRREDIDRA